MGKSAKKPEPDISNLLPEFTADDIAVETLSGDVRDVLLTHFRSIHVPWGHLNEEEQRDKIEALEKCAHDVVRRAVHLLTTQAFPVLPVQIGKWVVDKGI